jgi:3-methyladenine DNA glycosylase AlkD
MAARRGAAVKSPQRAAITARRQIARLAKPSGNFDASRYFRGTDDLRFYNIGTSRIRAMAREIFRTHRDDWSVDDAVAFANRLLSDPYLEVKGVGIEVMARYSRSFTPRLLPVWKSWLSKNYSSNWATTDAICGMLIGPLLVKHPALVRTVSAWAHHRNMWVRRASAVSLIPSVRKGLALDVAYRVARALHDDEEDLIQKAVGWMLREAGKPDMRRLERYLRTDGPRIPRTTVRYAIERFPPAARHELLTATSDRKAK